MPELRFDDRVAVVTGAGRGLGREYALLLAARGAKVVVNDPGAGLTGEGVDAGPAQQVAREISASGGDAIACTESVATAAGGKAIIDTALERYSRIDILIHNAGIVRRGSLKEMSYEDFDAVVDVHLRGAFHVVRPAFPVMCRAGYGRVVLTSSIGGLYGNHGVVNYCAAKAGVDMITRCGALELGGRGIRVVGIAPGLVETPLTKHELENPAMRELFLGIIPMKRAVKADEIAAAAVFLASDHARSINGDTIAIDGGSLTRGYPALLTGLKKAS